MNFRFPYDSPVHALRVIDLMRTDARYYVEPNLWLRRMLLVKERKLPHYEQLDALERRIKTHIITSQLSV